MASWRVVAKVRDNGYYIGWVREHPKIHMAGSGSRIEPKSKTSLVQIGGGKGGYQVLAQTTSHSVMTPHCVGATLFKKVYFVRTLDAAKRKANALKTMLVRKYDGLTRGRR